jgi:hypothetical protein
MTVPEAPERTQPTLPLRPGLPEQRTNDCERHGTTLLLAAPDVPAGKVFGKCQRRHRHREFLKFIETVDAALPADTGRDAGQTFPNAEQNFIHLNSMERQQKGRRLRVALFNKPNRNYAVRDSDLLWPRIAPCAAARRAIGTRYGEQET